MVVNNRKMVFFNDLFSMSKVSFPLFAFTHAWDHFVAFITESTKPLFLYSYPQPVLRNHHLETIYVIIPKEELSFPPFPHQSNTII